MSNLNRKTWAFLYMMVFAVLFALCVAFMLMSVATAASGSWAPILFLILSLMNGLFTLAYYHRTVEVTAALEAKANIAAQSQGGPNGGS